MKGRWIVAANDLFRMRHSKWSRTAAHRMHNFNNVHIRFSSSCALYGLFFDRSVLCHVRVAYVVNCLNRFPALMTSYIVSHLPERRNWTSCSNPLWMLWRRYQFRLAGLTSWKTLLGRVASAGPNFVVAVVCFVLQERDYVKHKQKKTNEPQNMSRHIYARILLL